MAPWQSRPLGTQVARNRVRGFGLLKPHTVPARIVSPLSGAFSTLPAFQVESVEQPWLNNEHIVQNVTVVIFINDTRKIDHVPISFQRHLPDTIHKLIMCNTSGTFT